MGPIRGGGGRGGELKYLNQTINNNSNSKQGSQNTEKQNTILRLLVYGLWDGVGMGTPSILYDLANFLEVMVISYKTLVGHR